MMSTPDVRPVGDLPNAIGKTAARALHEAGVDSLAKVSQHSAQELLALHGVGPKALRILNEALRTRSMSFRQDESF
ncbi:MAG TPA: helix-hairpin-helix domain-containing protein [Enteractinococcus sp.]